MNCLIELCFVASVYITGGLGVQTTVDSSDIDRTNSYGPRVGELALVAEMKNGMFFKLSHISGVDTEEDDYGFNAVIIGAKINLFSNDMRAK